MSVFETYSEYYDLFYKDKNYRKESHYVEKLLELDNISSGAILELGCGTGKHAVCLAGSGFSVLGLDMSLPMIEKALAYRSGLANKVAQKLEFRQSDVRQFDIEKKFDAIISLFHVISYQVTNDDLLATFRNARKHLNAGGVFIFDFWYGPGVLSDPPTVRIKRLHNERCNILRIAEPKMNLVENVVEVHYSIKIEYLRENKFEEIKEQHNVRYLFQPELTYLLQQCGFETTRYYNWMELSSLENNPWYGCCVAK